MDIIGWFNYFSGPIFFVVIIYFIFGLAKKNRKRYEQLYHESLANQKESIALLKEIRDLLKK